MSEVAYNASGDEYAEYERNEMHAKSAVALPRRHFHRWSDGRIGTVWCVEGRPLVDGTLCRLEVPRGERHFYDESDAPDGWRFARGGWVMVRA